MFILLLEGTAALHSNVKIHRLYEPEVLRLPFSFWIDEFEIKVPNQTRNQLRHLEDGNVFAQTCS